MNHRYYDLLLLSTVFFCLNVKSQAWERCHLLDRADEDAAYCPDGNTCCTVRSSTTNTSCIPSDMGKYSAVCCKDDSGGCPSGYDCKVNSFSGTYCQATPEAPMADYLTQRLPRYRMCSIENPGLRHLYGLEITPGARKLAYYSSNGSIDDSENPFLDDVEMVLIVIHGAGRNADDYFCSALAASRWQTFFRNVLVLAPWFMESGDHYNNESDFLVWPDLDENGSWRYGADSLSDNKVSSFTALDKLVETSRKIAGPSVPIVIAGHSSGGQMVNRWSFLTNSVDGKIKAIVANPSSFLYLTHLRKLKGDWGPPKTSACPSYNKWEWGLDEGGNVSVPYRDQAMENATIVATLVERYRHRRIIYLAGSLDKCESTEKRLSKEDRPCHSHGLETTCMDQLQGTNRLKRANTYMESLSNILWPSQRYNHQLVLVKEVGHDHSLMFNSPEGMKAIFETERPDSNSDLVVQELNR